MGLSKFVVIWIAGGIVCYFLSLGLAEWSVVMTFILWTLLIITLATLTRKTA